MATPTARVLRDGRPKTVPATALVPGDVLLLAPGDRVAADARLLRAQGLEVDEAALTGESLLVPKAATGGTDASRVVLEGSDVAVGTGWAVVVAVGRHTRLGATAAALALEETQQSPLGARLHRLMSQVMPLSAVAGALVTARGRGPRRRGDPADAPAGRFAAGVAHRRPSQSPSRGRGRGRASHRSRRGRGGPRRRPRAATARGAHGRIAVRADAVLPRCGRP